MVVQSVLECIVRLGEPIFVCGDTPFHGSATAMRWHERTAACIRYIAYLHFRSRGLRCCNCESSSRHRSPQMMRLQKLGAVGIV